MRTTLASIALFLALLFGCSGPEVRNVLDELAQQPERVCEPYPLAHSVPVPGFGAPTDVEGAHLVSFTLALGLPAGATNLHLLNVQVATTAEIEGMTATLQDGRRLLRIGEGALTLDRDLDLLPYLACDAEGTCVLPVVIEAKATLAALPHTAQLQADFATCE